MDVQVLIQPVGGRYRVSGFTIEVESATREEALASFKAELEAKLQKGAELVTLALKPTPRWLRHAGTLRADDPTIDAWKKAVEEYRQQVDEAEGIS